MNTAQERKEKEFHSSLLTESVGRSGPEDGA